MKNFQEMKYTKIEKPNSKIGRDRGFNQSASLSDKGLDYKEPILMKILRHITGNKHIYLGVVLVLIAALVVLLN